MKTKKPTENYLDKIPVRNPAIDWNTDEQGIVTLAVENKGFFNRIAQALLKKPKISYIHLDELGSFVWPLIDGEKSITVLGEAVDAQFGEKASPLYPRLAKYFQILASYGFVELK